MKAYGIDVSEWQGDINWSQVQTDFAVIRAGYGRSALQRDKKFTANYEGCNANNIPCGAYWYSYAVTPEDALFEAEACLEVIKGGKYAYPIYYDVEQPEHFALGKAGVSEIIRTFLNKLESCGYWVGLYMSAYYLSNYVEDDIRNRYSIWVAHHDVDSPDYYGSYGMWQRSSTGLVGGIAGNVDLDICYVDYPSEIRKACLNGFAAETTKYVELTIDGSTYAGELTLVI